MYVNIVYQAIVLHYWNGQIVRKICELLNSNKLGKISKNVGTLLAKIMHVVNIPVFIKCSKYQILARTGIVRFMCLHIPKQSELACETLQALNKSKTAWCEYALRLESSHHQTHCCHMITLTLWSWFFFHGCIKSQTLLAETAMTVWELHHKELKQPDSVCSVGAAG